MEGKKLLLVFLLVASACASPIPQGSDRPSTSANRQSLGSPPAAVRADEAAVEEEVEPTTERPQEVEETEGKSPDTEADQARPEPPKPHPEEGAVSDPIVDDSEGGDPIISSDGKEKFPISAKLADKVESIAVADKTSSAKRDAGEGQTPLEQDVSRSDSATEAPQSPDEEAESATEKADLRDESATEKLIFEAVEEEISSHSLFRSQNIPDEDDSTTLAPESAAESSDVATRVETALEEKDSTTVQPEPEEAPEELIVAASEVEETRVSFPKETSEVRLDLPGVVQKSEATTDISILNEPEDLDTTTEVPVGEELVAAEEEKFRFAAPIEIVEVRNKDESEPPIALKNSAPIEIVEITEVPDAEQVETRLETEEISEAPESNGEPDDVTEIPEEGKAAEDKKGNAPITSKKQPAEGTDYWLTMQPDGEGQESVIRSSEATTQAAPMDEEETAVEKEEASSPQAQEEIGSADVKDPQEGSDVEEVPEQKPKDPLTKPLVKESEKPKADPLQRGSEVHFQETNSLQRRLV